MNRKVVSHTQLKKTALKNSKVRKAYDDLEDELQLVDEMLHARKQAGITQEKLAKIMKTTPSSISRLESLISNGQPSPTFSTLKKYAHALGYRLSIKLVTKSNPMDYTLSDITIKKTDNSEAFSSIKKGLNQAIKHASGKGRIARIHRPKPVNVKKVRESIGMSQPEFAATFGISLGTLRHWERGDRNPHGPALVLLNVIKVNPHAVLEALDRE